MKSLGDHVQRVALDALGPEPEESLLALRPALRELRLAYAQRRPPDFSDPSIRNAYVLAYHPHHCVLAAESFAAAGTSLLGLRRKGPVRVTILGAGPAPELVALAWFLRESGTQIEADLVDREPGWEATRRTTITATVSAWPSNVRVSHHTADLRTAEGIAAVEPLLGRADLVTAQTLLTELTESAGDRRLLECLIDSCGADTRLLVIDFKTYRTTRQALDAIDAAPNAALLTTASFDLPAARPLPPLDTHLFADAHMLRPRSKLSCGLRVLARPGVVPERAPLPVAPTRGQQAALEAFRAFLQGDHRAFVLRGTAGTGKTTLVSALIDEAATRAFPVVLLAPTGQATRRLRDVTGRAGSTIHSHLYEFVETKARGDDAPLSRFVLRDPPRQPAVYVVDEASLIGDVPDAPDDITQAEVLFGEGRLLSDLLKSCLHADGSRIVFVGDPNQLPPVGEDTSPALEPDRLAELIGAPAVVAELDEVVRQDDGSGILDLAQAWHREGSTPTQCQHDPHAGIAVVRDPALDSWLSAAVSAGSAAVVAARNADVRSWNARIRDARGRGNGPPTPGETLLVIRTDPRSGVVNGDELDVVECDPEVTRVRLREREVTLRRAQLAMRTATGPVVFSTLVVEDLLWGASATDQRFVTGVLYGDFMRRSGLRPTQSGFFDAYYADEQVHALRATYAYARTCHRAQGGEWDHVVIDFAGVRAFGPAVGRWAYTALTRARRAVHLVHSGEAAFDQERLVAEASGCLEEEGLHVVRQRPIQSGVKLTIEGDGSSADVALYLKRGLPSAAVPSGPRCAALQDKAVGLLTRWASEIRERALPPLPDRLERRCARVAAILSDRGFDVQATVTAQHQVTLAISAGAQQAAITYYFRGTGELTREVSNKACGDVTLIDLLRWTIESTDG